MTQSIYILNGPNLNLLGTREPDVYGTQSLNDIANEAAAHAEKRGLSIDFRQSNHEGELIDWIHEAGTSAGGIIINAGAYTHTSVALLDAVSSINTPVIEVHLSNLFAREEFRHHSYISAAAKGLICGLGSQGYLLALDAFAAMLRPED